MKYQWFQTDLERLPIIPLPCGTPEEVAATQEAIMARRAQVERHRTILANIAKIVTGVVTLEDLGCG